MESDPAGQTLGATRRSRMTVVNKLPQIIVFTISRMLLFVAWAWSSRVCVAMLRNLPWSGCPRLLPGPVRGVPPGSRLWGRIRSPLSQPFGPDPPWCHCWVAHPHPDLASPADPLLSVTFQRKRRSDCSWYPTFHTCLVPG